MGLFFDDPGVRRQKQMYAWKQGLKDDRADQREMRRERQRELDRQQRERAAAVMARQRDNAALAKQYADQEKLHYGQPRTVYVGGNNESGKPIRVSHFAAPLPLCFITHPESPDKRVTFGPGFMRSRNGNLMNDAAWMAQARETKAIWDGIKGRYVTVLGRLRDDEWWLNLTTAAGLTHTHTVDETWEGQYSSGTRKLNTVTVPTIRKVSVAEDGLRISIDLDVRVPPKKWIAAVDVLRAGFKSAGAAAGNLTVSETQDGAPLLIFGDAPSSFPAAVAPPVVTPVSSLNEAVARYPKLTWQLGVDSRGNVFEPLLRKYPHVLVAGSTGGGKSVWIRSAVEALRVQGAAIWLVDGKRSDYVALATLPGVRMVSTEPEQHIIAVSEVYEEMEHRRVTASAAKAAGDPDPYSKFPPVVLVIDEFATVRDEWRTLGKRAKGGDENVISQVAALLRVGRETRCHLVIASQDIYVENVPQNWQDNLPLFVSLGAPSPRTLSGGAIPEALRGDAQRIGDRISRDMPGRSLYIDRSAACVREVQSFYGYSPGTTPPDAAPTPEVREAWAASEEVAQQVPTLYPRVGIRATSAEWRDQNIVELAEQETVALTDRDGNLLHGMERYDPLRADWLGAARRSGRKRRAAATFDDPPSQSAPVRSTPAAEQPSTNLPAGVTAEQLAAALALLQQQQQSGGTQPAPVNGTSTPAGSEKPVQTSKPTPPAPAAVPDQEEDDGW